MPPCMRRCMEVPRALLLAVPFLCTILTTLVPPATGSRLQAHARDLSGPTEPPGLETSLAQAWVEMWGHFTPSHGEPLQEELRDLKQQEEVVQKRLASLQATEETGLGQNAVARTGQLASSVARVMHQWLWVEIGGAVIATMILLTFGLVLRNHIWRMEVEHSAFIEEGVEEDGSSANLTQRSDVGTKDDKRYVVFEREELVEHLGASGLAVFDPNAKSDLSGLSMKWSLVLIALQSLCLQLGIMYFLSTRLLPHGEQPKHLPYPITFIAVYLHFIQCAGELPLSVCLLRHLHELHKDWRDLLVMLSVLVTDSFFVPFVSFFVGSLYLCTSRTIGEVILNACAVSFVNSIDNWILTMHTRSNLMSGRMVSKTIHIPINTNIMRSFSWWVCVCPLVPVLICSSMVYLGLFVLNL